MEFDQPQQHVEHGPFAIIRTSTPEETKFLERAALATADRDFHMQIESSLDVETGTTLVMRAFVVNAMNNVLNNHPLRNARWQVSKRQARFILDQISEERK